MQSVALQSSYDHGGITLNHRTRERGNFIFHATLTQSLHLTFVTSFFFPLISAFDSLNGLHRKGGTARCLLLSLQSLRNDDCDAVDNEKKFTKIYNARAQPLFYSRNLFFSDVLVAVAVVVFLNSLLIVVKTKAKQSPRPVNNENYWRDEGKKFQLTRESFHILPPWLEGNNGRNQLTKKVKNPRINVVFPSIQVTRLASNTGKHE